MVSAATRTANGSVTAATNDASSYVQENCAPDGATHGSNGSMVALKVPLKCVSDEPTSPPHSFSSTISDMTPPQTTPRRALQVIDANCMNQTPTTSRSAIASPASGLQQKPFKATGITGSAHGMAPLSGLKRKHWAADECTPNNEQRSTKQQQLLLSPRLGSAFDDDYESENLAWLDMLVALLERKYGKHSIPVPIKELEDARQFEPRKKSEQQTTSTASLSAGRECSASHTNSSSKSSSSRRMSGQHVAGKDQTLVKDEPSRDDQDRQDREKEERRQRILLRHAQQIQDASVSSSTCCGCKTGCLKMYCVCFSTRGFCHASCACEDCKNSRQNKEQRMEAIQSYLANDPRAFSFASHHQTAKATGFLQLLPQKSSSVVLRGCRCKKSKCLKKYCECYQNGIACTAHCRCVDCSNDPKSAHHLHKEKQASAAATEKSRAFHEIQVVVTKKPKRNYVQKSVRLAL